MKEVINEKKEIGYCRKLVRKLYKVEKSKEYPGELKFCIQYLYYQDNKWLEIVRIDNYLHQNKSGTHIHFFNKKKVKWMELNFKEAEKEVIRLAEKIIVFLEGEQNGKNNDC
ncbi:MAG: hypothetical protein KKF46_04505 [Nanoarchaeota archaeon]|nr:hypothetical protein [Nanoarchaeota archaeon]MBU1321598.1 hypothetical protein [Nanoarchaeota archaeon]MBU1598008.1 hypothetical protein [Nanoarchaeota archaeon]MBU2440958.1 hypothetical protein [Nanoarchaeota archaeon]